MAKLPVTKRIMREEISDAPNWISKLLNPLNLFMDGVYEALAGNLTFSDNIRAQIKDLHFTTPSTYVSGTASTFPVQSFLSSMKVTPSGLWAIKIVRQGNVYRPIEGALFVDWRYDDGTIFITNVTGLVASATYDMRVIVI